MTFRNPLQAAQAAWEKMSEPVARPFSEDFNIHSRVSGASITRQKLSNMRRSNPLAARVAQRGKSPVQKSRKRTASDATLDYTDCSITKRTRCEEHEPKPQSIPVFRRHGLLLVPKEGPMIVLTPSEDVSQACDVYLPAQDRSFLVVNDEKAGYPHRSLEENRRLRRFRRNRSYYPPMLTDEVPHRELCPRRLEQLAKPDFRATIANFSKLTLNPFSAPSLKDHFVNQRPHARSQA